MRLRWLLAAFIVVVAAFVAAGCGGTDGGGGGDDSELAKEQVLRVNIGSDVNDIDASKVNDVDSWNTINMMFVGLYRFKGDESPELEPWLATELPDVSDDGLTYTVKIRDDAKWSNGDKLTAADVKFGVDRCLNPETECPWAGFMGDIEKVDAPDDTTVVFTLGKPVPWFNGLMAVNGFYPLPQKVVTQFGDKWTDAENIVTSGPWHLEEWQREQSMSLIKSDTYYGADDITLERVEISMIPEPKTALRRFEQGEIDTGYLRRMVSPEDLDKWKSDDRYRSVSSTATHYAWFNTTNPELRDPKVRQGLAQAIDRKTMVEEITQRGDKPLNTIIPTPLPGYDTISQGAENFLADDGSPDLDKARELLEDGGFKDGTELSLYYTTASAVGPAIAQQIQSDLGKVGAKVKLVNIADGAALYEAAQAPVDPKIDIVMLGWGADYLDAQDYYQLWTCKAIEDTVNASNFCDKDFDALYNEAIAVVDEDERFNLYEELEGMLTGPDGKMPAVPLYQPQDDTVVQEWVKGVEITSVSSMYFEDVEIREH